MNNKIKEFKRIIKFIAEKLKSEGLRFYAIDVIPEMLWSQGSRWKASDEESLWKVDLPLFHQILINNLCESELPELAYIVINHTSEKKPKIGVVYITRSLLPRTKNIKLNIEEDYLKIGKLKMIVREITTSSMIVKYWTKIIGSDITRKEHLLIYFRYEENKIYPMLADLLDIHEIDCTVLNIKHKHAKIPSAKIEKSDKYVLINLWRIFMELNDLIQWKRKIYKKKKDSVQSYELVGELESFLKDTPFILMKLQEEFPIQLGETEINKIISDYYEEAYKLVEKLPNILVTKPINEKMIEYKNGVYDEEEEIFLLYENENHEAVTRQYGVVKYKGEEEYQEKKE